MTSRIFEALHLFRRKADNRAKFLWLVGNIEMSEEQKRDRDIYIVKETNAQAEVVHHPAVVAGVIAGNFINCLDLINAGKPIMTLPHHASQAVNSLKLAEAGCCRILINPSIAM